MSESQPIHDATEKSDSQPPIDPTEKSDSQLLHDATEKSDSQPPIDCLIHSHQLILLKLLLQFNMLKTLI